MTFELPIGTLIICLSLTCGWFSGDPIFYIWITFGFYLVGIYFRKIIEVGEQGK